MIGTHIRENLLTCVTNADDSQTKKPRQYTSRTSTPRGIMKEKERWKTIPCII